LSTGRDESVAVTGGASDRSVRHGMRCSMPWWGRGCLKVALYSLTSRCPGRWFRITKWSSHSRRRLPAPAHPQRAASWRRPALGRVRL